LQGYPIISKKYIMK